MGAVWVTLPGQVSHGQWDAVTHRPDPGLARAAGTGQHREHWAKWGTAGVAGCMRGDASFCVLDAVRRDAASDASAGKVLVCCKAAAGLHLSK